MAKSDFCEMLDEVTLRHIFLDIFLIFPSFLHSSFYPLICWAVITWKESENRNFFSFLLTKLGEHSHGIASSEWIFFLKFFSSSQFARTSTKQATRNSNFPASRKCSKLLWILRKHFLDVPGSNCTVRCEKVVPYPMKNSFAKIPRMTNWWVKHFLHRSRQTLNDFFNLWRKIQPSPRVEG